ncbi:MAG: hypothetical protein NT069_26320 [Planctomycetota bacterium]|nr:hypothetical protein [Planctomycetota bacterium]
MDRLQLKLLDRQYFFVRRDDEPTAAVVILCDSEPAAGKEFRARALRGERWASARWFLRVGCALGVDSTSRL